MRKYSLLIFIFLGCKLDLNNYERITMFNDSDSTLYVYWSYSDSITMENPLKLFDVERSSGEPFVVHGRVKDSIIIVPKYRLNPRNGGEIVTQGNESFFEESPDKRVRFFYISEHTMKTKTWNEIVEDQLYIKKETYSAEDLIPYYWSIEYYEN